MLVHQGEGEMKFLIPSHESLATSHQSPVTSYQSPTIPLHYDSPTK